MCWLCLLVFVYILILGAFIYSDFFFFFLHQKTAYEMRISDWSSDVCSSDLHKPADGIDGALSARTSPSEPRAPIGPAIQSGYEYDGKHGAKKGASKMTHTGKFRRSSADADEQNQHCQQTARRN